MIFQIELELPLLSRPFIPCSILLFFHFLFTAESLIDPFLVIWVRLSPSFVDPFPVVFTVFVSIASDAFHVLLTVCSAPPVDLCRGGDWRGA